MRALEHTDKVLFIQFRSGSITLNQFKARLTERRGVAKYKVIEDIWPNIHPQIKEELKTRPNIHDQIYGKGATVAEMQRPLEDWEFNPRCLRSIKYHHKKNSRRKKEGSA